MDKETDNIEEEDYNIDELLAEDDDSPVEEVAEESTPTADPKRRSRGRPKGTAKKKEEPEVPVEIAEAEKDLASMDWQPLSYVAFDGYQNTKTGEVIDEKEALRRALCYAQEAAHNTR